MKLQIFHFPPESKVILWMVQKSHSQQPFGCIKLLLLNYLATGAGFQPSTVSLGTLRQIQIMSNYFFHPIFSGHEGTVATFPSETTNLSLSSGIKGHTVDGSEIPFPTTVWMYKALLLNYLATGAGFQPSTVSLGTLRQIQIMSNYFFHPIFSGDSSATASANKHSNKQCLSNLAII